jgi:hypothetical protein
VSVATNIRDATLIDVQYVGSIGIALYINSVDISQSDAAYVCQIIASGWVIGQLTNDDLFNTAVAMYTNSESVVTYKWRRTYV